MTDEAAPARTSRRPVFRGMWDFFVAWFFCLPATYASEARGPDWIAHSRLAAFVFFGAIPLSGFSWFHMTGLLYGPSTVVQGGVSAFMMGVLCLLDSTICGAIGRGLSVGRYASVLVRLVFATCVAAFLAVGAVLFMLGDQVYVQRQKEEQKDRQTFAEVERANSRLLDYASATSEARRALELATAAVGREPESNRVLSSQGERCFSDFERLEKDTNASISAASLTKKRLKATGGQDADPQIQFQNSVISQGFAKLREAKARCESIQNEARAASAAYNSAAQETFKRARQAFDDAQGKQAAVEVTTNGAIAEQSAATKKAWANNMGANIKAAVIVIKTELWARICTIMVFALVLLIELSAIIGKMGLANGHISRLVANEDKVASHRIELRDQILLASSAKLAEVIAVVAAGHAKKRVDDELAQEDMEAVFKSVAAAVNAEQRVQAKASGQGQIVSKSRAWAIAQIEKHYNKG